MSFKNIITLLILGSMSFNTAEDIDMNMATYHECLGHLQIYCNRALDVRLQTPSQCAAAAVFNYHQNIANIPLYVHAYFLYGISENIAARNISEYYAFPDYIPLVFCENLDRSTLSKELMYRARVLKAKQYIQAGWKCADALELFQVNEPPMEYISVEIRANNILKNAILLRNYESFNAETEGLFRFYLEVLSKIVFINNIMVRTPLHYCEYVAKMTYLAELQAFLAASIYDTM